MREVVKKYNIIQLGLTFIVGDINTKYQAYPFTFYLFPRENWKNNACISMQANTV